MPPKEKYTDPDLRDEVKEEIHQGDKGGAPGQWSARKAQMMASEYKKRGGGYNTDKKDQDESQKHLSKWGEEDWQTKDGSGNAKQDDGSEKRYLPKEAWDKMSEKEKKETDEKKLAGSRKGKQYVQNTDKAKASRKEANADEEERFEDQEAGEEDGEDDDEDKNGDQDEEEEGDQEEEYQDDEDADDDVEDEDGGNNEHEADNGKSTAKTSTKNAKAGQKRTNNSTTSNTSSKKQKSDSKADKTKDSSKTASSPGPAGSADRLPKKGQKVQWHSLPGYVSGEVVEIVYEEKTVEGKKVKGAEGDPRIVLKSDSSGKIAVHKPEAVYFE